MTTSLAGLLTRVCTTLSRLINRASGGQPGQTLCARVARRHGHDCWFCRLVGFVTRDRDHCWAALLADITKK